MGCLSFCCHAASESHVNGRSGCEFFQLFIPICQNFDSFTLVSARPLALTPKVAASTLMALHKESMTSRKGSPTS